MITTELWLFRLTLMVLVEMQNSMNTKIVQVYKVLLYPTVSQYITGYLAWYSTAWFSSIH